MIVYLTYFRYDRGETYSLYHMSTSKTESIKHYKEEDLPNFLGYGPDDVSQLYLVRCNLSKKDYLKLQEYYETEKSEDSEFMDLMDDINNTWGNDDLIYSDSGDTNWEVVEFFVEGCDPEEYLSEVPDDEDELEQQLQEVLFENEELYNKVLKNFIKKRY